MKELIEDTFIKNIGRLPLMVGLYLPKVMTTIEEFLLLACCNYIRCYKYYVDSSSQEKLAQIILYRITQNLNQANFPFEISTKAGCRESNLIKINTFSRFISIGKKYFVTYEDFILTNSTKGEIWDSYHCIMKFDGNFNNTINNLLCLLLKDNFVIDQDLLNEYKEKV